MLVVEDEREARARIREELERRYGSDYIVTCEGSALAALEKLERWSSKGRPVALVLADQWMPELTGEEFLARAKPAPPRRQARPAGELRRLGRSRDGRRDGRRDGARTTWTTTCSSRGGAPDEYFHRTITEFLCEWTRASSYAPQRGRADRAGGCRRARTSCASLLTRNGVPHVVHDTDSEEGAGPARGSGATGTRDAGRGPARRRRARQPQQRRAGRRRTASAPRSTGARDFDVAVVGAGPAGLAAAVYASSEGLRHSGDRARVDRWPGRVELADPQLPRLRARRQRLPSSPSAPTSRPGSSARASCYMRAVTGAAPRRRATTCVRSPTAARRRRAAVILATGISYRRLASPSSTRCSARASSTARRCPRRRGHAGAGGLRGRRRELRRPGSPAPGAATRAGHVGRAPRVVGARRCRSYLIDAIEAAPNIERATGHRDRRGCAGDGAARAVKLRDDGSGEPRSAARRRALHPDRRRARTRRGCRPRSSATTGATCSPAPSSLRGAGRSSAPR